MAGKSKQQAIKFAKTDKKGMKDPHTKTRTGALKSRNRARAHGKTHKH